MASSLEPMPITSQKHDPAWKHCQMFKNGERVQLKCIYCGKLFKGGGIHRIKEHLAGHKGNASTCVRVPPDVRVLMQESLDGVVVKKRRKQKIEETILNVNPVSSEMDAVANHCEESTGLQLTGVLETPEPKSSLLVNLEGTSNRSGERRKRERGKNSLTNAAIADVGALTGSVALGSKRVNTNVHLAIGRFLFDIGAPLNAVNSVYFQPMIDAIASGGSVVLPPSYHDLRGWILKNSVEEMKNETEKYKATWARTGCSVLVDHCCTESGRNLLSFFVYCPEGTVFLRSEDVSDISKSSDALYELFRQVVEEVGVKNVLQVINNGEEQYTCAGRRLTDTFPTLFWTPCATCCIDLILEDFRNLEWINAVIEQARSISKFVYNHSLILNMVRRYTFGNDIIERGVTHSATNFAALKRMVDLKHNLQAMVTSQEWMDCPHSKKTEGLAMLDFLTSQSFWSSCILIVRLTYPLLRLLRIVNSEKRPAMGYVYAGMYRAKETIKKELLKREDYMVYWNIIDHRWEQHRQLPLHAAGFYLNPEFFYSVEGDMHNEILSGMFDCIERLVPDTKVQDKIIKEINSYKNAIGDFGRKMAIRARDSLLPAEWWSTYGGGCPNLARLAIRILSQTCSSISGKQNGIPVEQIYDTRNYLERQRLSDLVFVRHNLRLGQMVGMSKEQDYIDPISFDCIDVVEDWTTGKDISVDDYGSMDWTSVDPPSISTTLLGSSNDEAEDLGAGFDDHEIFNRDKEGEENNDDIMVHH
ncbi:uncharacterized protein LOC121246372 [Juglans microcarpa x Juglans regia]|uniref:uncharacterized protein LOC121246372 n=1 Tax=Juglans microcarpa x Juglans regia TaxID=2249226 RepID=UPI001B7ED192|nr:uncharacterized protein LOC121246372 [Juglans microcarpa x Juglans regia]